jgi:hypothetical protein
MKDLFKYDILKKNSNVNLTFYISDKALERIRHDILGKTALFTDRTAILILKINKVGIIFAQKF